jgi:hypothetical protein
MWGPVRRRKGLGLRYPHAPRSGGRSLILACRIISVNSTGFKVLFAHIDRGFNRRASQNRILDEQDRDMAAAVFKSSL